MSTETNNTTNAELRKNLSELDQIFIPEDLDGSVNLEDVMNFKYSVLFWRTVPKNYSLVSKNIFTQEVSNIDGHGIRLVAPIATKTILVSRHAGTRKYTDVKAFSKDGIELKVDFSVVMQISNPAQYIVSGKQQAKQLNSLINRLLLNYVSTFGFEEVITGKCSMARFDPLAELGDFENEYGISVISVHVEKVTLPEHIMKLYNDEAEARQRLKAAKIESDTTIVNATAQAEATRITEAANADAFAEHIAKLIKKLKDQGMPSTQIKMYVQEYIAAYKIHTMAQTGDVHYFQNYGDTELGKVNKPKQRTRKPSSSGTAGSTE